LVGKKKKKRKILNLPLSLLIPIMPEVEFLLRQYMLAWDGKYSQTHLEICIYL